MLEQNADEEAVSCERPTYGAVLFRKGSLTELEAERALYRGEAVPGSLTPIPSTPTGSRGQFDGLQYAAIHSDGNARVYWDSGSCLCGGIIRAPDDDVAAAIGFWRDG